MRSFAVHPLSFFAFFNPLYTNSSSFAFAITADDDDSPMTPPIPLVLPPQASDFNPGSDIDDDAITLREREREREFSF